MPDLILSYQSGPRNMNSYLIIVEKVEKNLNI